MRCDICRDALMVGVTEGNEMIVLLLSPPFRIFLDEFQTISSIEVIEEMLAELRFKGVLLDLAHQGQDEKMIEAVLRTAYTKICWRPSGKAQEKEFAGFNFESK